MTDTNNDFECQECGLPKKIGPRRELCMCDVDDAACAAECVAAFKPLADVAASVLNRPAVATITIENPGRMTIVDRIALAKWLQERATYVMSDDHIQRSTLAARCSFVYPPVPDGGGV